MASLNSPNNLVITGYDKDVTWVDSSSNTLMGQSNLFVYEFDIATGNQVGIDNYQYLVQHVEPVGDEFNFWIGQLPLIYYPDISYGKLDIEGDPYYYHIGYKTDTSVIFTEADMFKTQPNKINDCDSERLSINPSPIAITNVSVFSGATPNSANPFTLTNAPVSPITLGCSPTLSVEDNFIKESGLYIYPNPAKNSVTIKIYGEENTVVNYKVYSIIGTLVIKGKTTNSINIKSLSNGIYIIEVEAEKTKYLKKLIVQ